MAKKSTIIVTDESKSGRNKVFLDTNTNKEMNRAEFVKKIEKGEYPNYTVKKIHGLKTPVSKPDGDTSNNLG